jgi:hypothetical protein
MLCTTSDLTFTKKTSSHVVTTPRRISKDPGTGSRINSRRTKYQWTLSTTTSVHTRILAEYIVSDQDWCRYLHKYPDEAVTFYNAGYPVIHRLLPTMYTD